MPIRPSFKLCQDEDYPSAVEFPKVFPATVAGYRDNHPECLHTTHPEGTEPAACPLEDGFLRILKGSVPCRNTRRDCTPPILQLSNSMAKFQHGSSLGSISRQTSSEDVQLRSNRPRALPAPSGWTALVGVPPVQQIINPQPRLSGQQPATRYGFRAMGVAIRTQ